MILQSVEELEDRVTECLEQCPRAEQDLMDITERAHITSEKHSAEILLQLRHAYHSIAGYFTICFWFRRSCTVSFLYFCSALNIELLIDKCKDFLEQLSDPNDLKTIRQHPLLAEKQQTLTSASSHLLRWRLKLQGHWQATEGQIVVDARMMKNHRKMKKVSAGLHLT
jgi:hypothetical protein